MTAQRPVNPADFDIALAVLQAVAQDRGTLAGVPEEQRILLQRLAGEVARPDLKQRKKLQRELLRQELKDKRAHDEEQRQKTGIQQLRQAPVFAPPLPALPAFGDDAHAWQPPAAAPAASGDDHGDDDGAVGEPLHTARKCYVCKQPYLRLHRFYDQLCPRCGNENEARRTQTADLRGRTALITGARVKIGYQAALLLLRAGCDVVACTRFPRDAAARYAREPDFAQWQHRLRIYGIDLRHTPSVEQLAHHLDQVLPRLDFQIHNACQTVRRPPGFYAHLLEGEDTPLSSLPQAQRALVEDDEALRRTRALPSPALLTQARTSADLALEQTGALEIFPKGVLDQDLQQVDLRTHNSWRATLHEVPTLELLEVMLVNATAPFVLTARLKALMLRQRTPPEGTATSTDDAKHVVMVSAMEGQFYREHKTDKHPHTNMAKAALNMLVRTSAVDLLKDRIFLNAVDTGWVTDEDPVHLAQQKVEEHRFSPPLDIVDGAARIVAPLMEGFATGVHASGVFFKDYRATPW